MRLCTKNNKFVVKIYDRKNYVWNENVYIYFKYLVYYTKSNSNNL